MKHEIALLRGLNHPNIVKYIYTDISPDKRGVDILLEYMPAGSLKSLLDKYGAFDEGIIRRFMRQILEGLKYLHSKGVIHRDLKCANVLVDNSLNVKLSDFGSSKKISFSDNSGEKDELSKSLKGSPYWMAPEVVLQTGHNKSADIWSLGCVLIEMRTGRPPWSEISGNAVVILQEISKTKTGPKIPVEQFSTSALSFIRRCLKINPQERPTADELLKDPFITMKFNPGDGRYNSILQEVKSGSYNFSEQIPRSEKEKERTHHKQNIIEEEKNDAYNMDKMTIKSKYAMTMEKQRQEEELKQRKIKEEKESKRRQWEEELRRELVNQKKSMNN